MAYEWAKPGVKCVCIDATFVSGPSPLVPEAVYEIAAVVGPVSTKWGKYQGTMCLCLVGVDNPMAPITNGFAIGRFRPLITKTQEQDTEMFLRIASPSPLERLDRLAEELDSLYND